MSQKTGRPPAWTIAWVAETKVIELVNTSWPSTSAAIMARCRAAVAELRDTAWRTPR